MLGFIEKENATHWLKEVNSWIEDLAKKNNDWRKDEALSETEKTTDFCIVKSIAHRKSDAIDLTHLWITLN